LGGGAGECGRPGATAIYKRAGINSPRRVAGRPSAVAFTARGRRCAEKKTMRERRDDEDDDRPLSPISRGHTTRGNFPRRFARVSFVRSPRARPGRPGMAWARQMDEGPDPGEIKNPRARVVQMKKSDAEDLVGLVSERRIWSVERRAPTAGDVLGPPIGAWKL
jgi:hypothetical protein